MQLVDFVYQEGKVFYIFIFNNFNRVCIPGKPMTLEDLCEG